jgi:hypothetical protein
VIPAAVRLSFYKSNGGSLLAAAPIRSQIVGLVVVSEDPFFSVKCTTLPNLCDSGGGWRRSRAAAVDVLKATPFVIVSEFFCTKPQFLR